MFYLDHYPQSTETKQKATTFDQLWGSLDANLKEGKSPIRKPGKKPLSQSANAWASVGLEVGKKSNLQI